jgi:archaellum component FlaC
VAGLSKGPRRATKRSLKKLEDTIKKLESKENTKDRINRLKSFGVFIKNFNMSHLLVTRYSIKEDFGLEKAIKKLDDMDAKVKETNSKINRLEHEKKEEGKKEIEELKKKLGEQKDEYKEILNDIKSSFGTELFNRYMQGFVRGNNATENERQEHTEFLFKKLKF